MIYARRKRESAEPSGGAGKAAAVLDPEPAPEPDPPAYLTISMIAETLGVDVGFLRPQFNSLPGVLRVGNGGDRRKKVLIPRAVFEQWLVRNTVRDGGERITYKRFRKSLVKRRTQPQPTGQTIH